MNNSLKIKRLVGIATLTALVIVLQFISTYVKIGNLSITLALIPIVVGAILYGPLAGLFLGMVMGVVVIVDPSTIQFFMPINPFATILLCLLKTGLAGLISGLLFKLINKLKFKGSFYVAIIVASLVCPIINTSLFIIGASIFFKELYGADNTFITVFSLVITTNFAIEFAINVILSPALVSLIKALTRNYNLGFSIEYNDDEKVIDEDITIAAE